MSGCNLFLKRKIKATTVCDLVDEWRHRQGIPSDEKVLNELLREWRNLKSQAAQRLNQFNVSSLRLTVSLIMDLVDRQIRSFEFSFELSFGEPPV